MRCIAQSRRTSGAGFTRTELLVLLGVTAVFSVALAADLTQTKLKLLQQACAANLKQWGMAFNLYSQDYNGTFYYDVMGNHWDDANATSPSPYVRYLGGNGSPTVPFTRNIRICPAVAVRFTQEQINGAINHSYSMPVGRYRRGFSYANADSAGSPYYSNLSYWPNLKSCPNPSKYLLLIDGNGRTLYCGGLVSAISTTNTNPTIGTDAVPAVNRHGGAVNCLFGDFHVELVTAQTITNQDAISCNTPPGNPWFTLN